MVSVSLLTSDCHGDGTVPYGCNQHGSGVSLDLGTMADGEQEQRNETQPQKFDEDDEDKMQTCGSHFCTSGYLCFSCESSQGLCLCDVLVDVSQCRCWVWDFVAVLREVDSGMGLYCDIRWQDKTLKVGMRHPARGLSVSVLKLRR